MPGLFSHRLATIEDLPALRGVMRRSIEQLQDDFLTPEQVRASHRVMGLDTQLITDGTYFIVEEGKRIAGCGGWSWRSTLYGGDASVVEREPRALDSRSEPARIRAMYTDPDFTRRGVGRLIINAVQQRDFPLVVGAVTVIATLFVFLNLVVDLLYGAIDPRIRYS